MNVISSLLLISDCLLLLIAVRTVWKLMSQLPHGHIRNSWRILSILVFFFICGYLGYSYLFLGAVFVLLVSSLSLATASDIKRIFTLEYESTTDVLMGIYIRRYLVRRLHEEFFRSKRYAFPLSVILLDIDHFKLVNDRYGHQVGDQVLRRLAELIVTTVRESDVVARYGGEEVMLVLPHTKGRNGLMLAERLRFAVENTVMVAAGERGSGPCCGSEGYRQLGSGRPGR